MCGFAGVITWDDRLRVTREVLGKMSARVAHRGPDGEGTYLNHESEVMADRPQVGLVHRRLAILDLNPRANQPFADGRGHWIVFNGEIYNFRELRHQLSSLDPTYAWRTNCDTEVLLAAYAQWGEDCAGHLEGMFAFAIWDEEKRSLLLARDRMGQKPLYVARSQSTAGNGKHGAIAFASEVQALFPLTWVGREIDQDGLVEYLAWGHTTSSQSIYRGIEQVLPGAIQVEDGHVARRLNYWTEPSRTFTWEEITDERAVAETREKLCRAVRHQLVSDVPIGCFLSGGIDSSIIAAAMKAAAAGGQKVHTFSIGFDDPRYDESEYAARVSAHLGTDHHRFTVRPDAAHDLPKIAEAFGEPFGDSSALPTYYLARETRQHVKVALSGDGGDELFGGYDRYRAMRLGERLRTALTPLTWAVLASMFRHFSGGHPKSRWERARRFGASLGLSPARRYSSYLRLFDRDLLARLVREPPANLLVDADRVESMFDRMRIADPMLTAMACDRMLYLPDDLLTKVDRCSMQFALEVRSPFMDHGLVEFAGRLSPRQLLRGGPKRMLREAFAGDLPGWVFGRKKMGFAVPIGEWFRGELRSMLRDHLFAVDSFAAGHFEMRVVEKLIDEHERQRVDHSQRLYAMLMLELWWRNRVKSE